MSEMVVKIEAWDSVAHRQAIHDGNWEVLRDLVPETTYAYFTSPEGAAVCKRIQAETNVIHY